MNNIIVGMGEALWDVLPEGKKIGGAPANFAYHVSQFGFDSRVVSAVGNDELGDEIMSVFKEKKLNTQIERVDYPTGTVQVTLDAEGVPCYEIKEGVAWDNIPFTDELKRLALNTRAVCFGSLAQRNEASRATINRFLDTMPEIDGQLKIFDINLRQDFYTKEVLRDSFQRCNVLKINDEELVTISRMFGYPGIDLQDKCWILLAKYNLKMLILTCGINGSYVFTPGVVSFQETPKVPVADTVGAGDSFTAAFCASILNGKPVPEAHKLAVEVSAYVCTQSGAMPELPQVLKDRLLSSYFTYWQIESVSVIYVEPLKVKCYALRGSVLITYALKKQATGGKMRLTDITDMENFFRLIQSVLCVLLKENHYLYPDIE